MKTDDTKPQPYFFLGMSFMGGILAASRVSALVYDVVLRKPFAAQFLDMLALGVMLWMTAIVAARGVERMNALEDWKKAHEVQA